MEHIYETHFRADSETKPRVCVGEVEVEVLGRSDADRILVSASDEIGKLHGWRRRYDLEHARKLRLQDFSAQAEAARQQQEALRLEEQIRLAEDEAERLLAQEAEAARVEAEAARQLEAQAQAAPAAADPVQDPAPAVAADPAPSAQAEPSPASGKQKRR